MNVESPLSESSAFVLLKSLERSVLVRIGFSPSILQFQPSSNELPSADIDGGGDSTTSSRIASMGGLVTCEQLLEVPEQITMLVRRHRQRHHSHGCRPFHSIFRHVHDGLCSLPRRIAEGGELLEKRCILPAYRTGPSGFGILRLLSSVEVAVKAILP